MQQNTYDILDALILYDLHEFHCTANNPTIINIMTSSNGNIFCVTGPLCGKSPVNSPHKGQWCEALVFSLICARTKQNRQPRHRWIETPSRPLWLYCTELSSPGWLQSQGNTPCVISTSSGPDRTELFQGLNKSYPPKRHILLEQPTEMLHTDFSTTRT